MSPWSQKGLQNGYKYVKQKVGILSFYFNCVTESGGFFYTKFMFFCTFQTAKIVLDDYFGEHKLAAEDQDQVVGGRDVEQPAEQPYQGEHKIVFGPR